MKRRNRKSALLLAGITFLLIYTAAALLPTAARQREGQKAERPSPSARTETEKTGVFPGFSDASKAQEAVESPGDVFTLVDRAADKTYTLTTEELLPAAIACEMDLSSPPEALKAQAVACYTFFCRKRSLKEIIACDTENWQVWTTPEQMRERWGEDYEGFYAILQNAAEAVKGQVLTQDGEPILAAYFAISAGATESSANVWGGDLPYLQAVASPGDMLSDGYLSTVQLTKEEFQNAAAPLFPDDPPDFSGPPETWLTGLEYTPSGYVRTGALCGQEVTGSQLRTAFSLRSAAFSLSCTETGFTFTVRGWGHGVGMSQTGAAFLAKRGADYGEILRYYYPGAVLTAPI